MAFLQNAWHFITHLDAELDALIVQYGTLTYLILFLIVFTETGLVIMPFLPGDSLLFAAGAVAGRGSLNLWLVYVLCFCAALIGDNVNFFIGKFLGPRLFREGRRSRFLRKEHLDKTHAFFARYGGKTIIIARFVPIVRTFAPFTAGLGAMQYRQFIGYSILGAILWVGSCVTLGYAFGQNDFVKRRFEVVIIAVIMISLVPALIEYLKHRRATATQAPTLPPGE
jgi:membrane-associated protein